MKQHLRQPGLLCALLLSACRESIPETPTFSAHVAPILEANCAQCHRPDGAAPFPLVTYNDARERAPLIAAATRAGRMPPWLPERTDFPFADERRLSERELMILERWANRGAPAGTIKPSATKAVMNGEWLLGEPDLVLEMPAPYPLRPGRVDVFRNFVLSVPLTERRYVRAVELLPGDARVVHHAVMAVDPTRISREEDAGDAEPGFDGMFARQGARPPPGFFVGWTPGRVPRPNPRGLAWPLEPGNDLVVQMHLRPHGANAKVRAKVGLYFTDTIPTRTPVLLRLGSQTIDIPAGESQYTVTDSVRLPVDTELLGLYPHAHYLGKSMDVRAVLPGGGSRQLLRIDNWDFNWQDAYTFARPVSLPAGTTITLRYVYDNSAANPRNPSVPPGRVVYGANSTDEMAELWIQAVPRSAADLSALQQEIGRKAAHDRVEGWQHLIRLNPRDATAHANLGAFYTAVRDLDRAVEHYQRALAVQPNFAGAHYNLGIVLETHGDRAGAIEHYRAALRYRPDHAGTHNNLGNVLLAQGAREEAARHFQRAIALEPAQAEAHNNLGRLLWDAGKEGESIGHYRQAIAADSSAAAPHFNLALALVATRRAVEGMREFEEGVHRQTNAVEAYVAMAWLLATHRDAAVRNPEHALLLAERAARLAGAPQPRILDVLGAAHAASGGFDQAIDLAQQALTLANRAKQNRLARGIFDRLQLYVQQRPYIQPGSDR